VRGAALFRDPRLAFALKLAAMAEAARAAQPMMLARGDVFADRYVIEDLLGRGGMGSVYRARDLTLGEPIALKIMHLGPEPSPLAMARFRQEVKLARRVTHPSVARVFDIGERDGTLYLTMEVIEGETLRQILTREQRLEPARAVRVAHELLSGLAAVHAAGIVHRDVKPSNVLIDRAGRVVLGDFGIARNAQTEGDLTVGVLGTPHYMAPEQERGDAIDGRVDIFAVGLVLFEMLTGRRAPPDPVEEAEQLTTRAPPSLVAVTLAYLARDPEGRPRDARAAARALADVARDVGVEEVTRTQPVTRLAPIDPEGVTSASSDSRPLPSLSPPVVIVRESRALAVLPFVCHGSKENDFLGEVMTDELVDVLSRVRGLLVFGACATGKYRDARDPRVIGRELDAFAVVDGTVQSAGSRVRIGVRLADAATGAQLWSGHHDGRIEDLFAFQEATARRIAEELRVEITTITHRGNAPEEALDHYVWARRKLRTFDYVSTAAAAEQFARCLERAPDFTPALAGHALASIRAWFLSIGVQDEPDWDKAARESVARAEVRAPDLAETHLAAAMYAAQHGDYKAAVASLGRALALAPTFAEAHEYLGILECEASADGQGPERLALAIQLNPELANARWNLARSHALHGRDAECMTLLAEVEQRDTTNGALAGAMRSRIAAWRGDSAGLSRIVGEERFTRTAPVRMAQAYARGLLGELDADGIEARLLSPQEASPHGRRLVYAAELLTEVFAGRGDRERALVHLERASELSLIDVTWLDLCPLLAPLRSLPRFITVRRETLARAETVMAR
jgi:eukaryotic-like serine/threonine-protein kinase